MRQNRGRFPPQGKGPLGGQPRPTGSQLAPAGIARKAVFAAGAGHRYRSIDPVHSPAYPMLYVPRQQPAGARIGTGHPGAQVREDWVLCLFQGKADNSCMLLVTNRRSTAARYSSRSTSREINSRPVGNAAVVKHYGERIYPARISEKCLQLRLGKRHPRRRYPPSCRPD